MPKVSPIQCDFSAGEFSPLTQGRVDVERYKKGLATCLNYVPTLQGPLVRRPGTYYVAGARGQTVRLIPFEFSTTQAYIIEATDLKFRFYMNNGQITVAGLPYEVSTPYAAADLFDLKFVQSADTLYIVHPSYAPRKLTRTAHTSWTLTTIDFKDGPYDDVIDGSYGSGTATGIDVSGIAVGSINITLKAASVTYVNSGSGFLSTDVGRLIRIWSGSGGGNKWGYAKITAYTDSTHVTANLIVSHGNGLATLSFRLGLWSDTTGFPRGVSFHEDRLVFAGSKGYPDRIVGSADGDYENFNPSGTDGTITAADSYDFALNSNEVNVLEWLISDEKGLLSGTTSSEWSVRPSSQGDALSAVNVNAKKTTSYGSSTVQPIQAGSATIHVQRAGKMIRELVYSFDKDGYRSIDITELANHITGPGVKQLAFQKVPHPIIWVVRTDGVLAAITYDRDSDTLRVGASRHVMGGYDQDLLAVVPGIDRTAAKVTSAAVIPSADGTRQELWLSCERRVNGSSLISVEYMKKFDEDTDDLEDLFFVDCGLTYDVHGTIESVTTVSAEARVAMTAHPFANGDTIKIEDDSWTALNNKYFKVVLPIAADYFTIHTEDDFPVNISGMTANPHTGGIARKVVTSVSGLSYLEGETVSILVDGAPQPQKTVTSGTVAISPRGARIHVGLPYASDGKMLRLEAGAADGTALGKTRRTHRAAFDLFRTLGLKIGMSFDKLVNYPFRKAADTAATATPLYSGLIQVNLESPYDTENQICFRQDEPLPGTILAIAPQMVTQDRG